MFSPHCIFCNIITKKIPSTPIAEDDYTLVIKDIDPKAPIHYLILPKKHLIDMSEFDEQNDVFSLAMCHMVRNLAKALEQPASFNVISNNGAAAGQQVFHSHWHFISGKRLTSIL